MNTIIPVASGKGGVGKTLLTANLGVSLARRGKTTVLVDLDLGGSNLHTCLGITNNKSGVGQLVYKQEPSLESLLTETNERRLYFIAGDSLLPGTANLPFFRKRSLIAQLNKIVADYVLLDLGSGTAHNVLDFYLTQPAGILVIAPETTSILNAYAFLKNALYRHMIRRFPAKSEERRVVHEVFTGKVEGNTRAIPRLVERLGDLSSASAEEAQRVLREVEPRIVLNSARYRDDLTVGERIRTVSEKNLGLQVHFLGVLATDQALRDSVLMRTPEITRHPHSAYSEGIGRITDRLIDPEAELLPTLRDAERELNGTVPTQG